MAISDKIKEYRVKRGMTQAQLAELLGVTPQAISKWEKAIGYPDLSAIPISPLSVLLLML